MKPEFIRKRLDNGLVILFEKRKLPVVSISASVKQGFAYETEKKKGISHFTEHLVFKGTKTRTHDQIVKEIERKGGILNAYTDEEVTSYWNKIPNKHFDIGMDISCDLILNPKLDESEFEKEKRIILEELKMYKDNPQLHVLDRIKELLYKKPLGLSGIGTEKSLLSIDRQDLADFYESHYKTNRMFLCVVGNASLDKIEEFGKKFPKNGGEEVVAKPIKINKEVVEKRRGVDQANFVLGFHISDLRSKMRYANEIFNAILAGGMSSRLFEEIREKRGLAYAVKGSVEQGKNFGYQIIYVGTTKGNVDLCKDLILKEIKEMKNLDKKDFEEAKEQLIGLRKVASEESANVMSALVHEEIAGDANEFYKYEERVSDVKLKDLKEISKIKGFSSIALIPEQ